MWRTRPVFISSTFQDMQAERDYLRSNVFPELEERLRARRHYLGWVDLRLGIATDGAADEGASEARVLKHCLDEVQRCRPFLIVLVGDRYGWVPPADRLEAAGFAAGYGGRSVTDLEIELGILSDPDQQQRSLFYFREPLPYDDLPAQTAALYSDARAPGSAAIDGVARLAELKRRIEAKLPGRVRHYAVAWDRSRQRVTELENFGRMVLEDLWAELADETARHAGEADISWQQAERNALDDFADDRARDFVGRQAIVTRLMDHCGSPTSDDVTRVVCVIGEPGSGKSALFAELFRRAHESDAFVLAHAAGASPQSASVDTMLLRWIDELGATLGVGDIGIRSDADAQTIETAFNSLRGRMEAQRRVVILIDAVDQFENTPRARFGTWLQWGDQSNTRLFVTMIADDAAQAWAARSGTEMLALSPLDADEARRVIERICARYHRTFEPQVIDAMLAKRRGDAPAWANPLWLVLAVEELNLLDADDFSRMHRAYSGTPAERLRGLMLDIIAAMPTDIPGLYDATFERAAELFGAATAFAFLGFIAVSRGGWRDNDFVRLLPRASGEPWQELQFAALRRLFRGQIRSRGVPARWDFNHNQMRVAARARLPALGMSELELNALIADHLLSLPTDDPLHVSETMFHLMTSGNFERAARYYGDRSMSPGAGVGASKALADLILARHDVGSQAGVEMVVQMLGALSFDRPEKQEAVAVASARILVEVEPLIRYRAPSRVMATLCNGLVMSFGRLTEVEPRHPGWWRGLADAQEMAGVALRMQGDLARALAAYRAALATKQQLSKILPDDPGRESGSLHENIGNTLEELGDRAGALDSYKASRELRESVAKAHPADHHRQADLARSHNKLAQLHLALGDINAASASHMAAFEIRDRLTKANPRNFVWYRDLSITFIGMGDTMRAREDGETARTCYKNSLIAIDRAIQLDPENPTLQYHLGISFARIGGLLMAQGDYDGALMAYQSNNEISARLAKADPDHVAWQRELAVAAGLVGDVLLAQGKLPAALESYQMACAAVTRVAGAEPRDTGVQSDLAISHTKVGQLLYAQQSLGAALESFEASHAIFSRLVKLTAENGRWQLGLSTSHDGIGDILFDQGKTDAALANYQTSLEIRERFIETHADDTNFQSALAVSCGKLGSLFARIGRSSEALAMFRRGLEVITPLAERTGSQILQQQVADFNDRISSLSGRSPS